MNVISNTRVSYKLRRFYEFLCLLTVEPYFFAFMFVFAMKKVPSDQLIQDKICRLTYKLDTTYCTLLPTMSANEDYFNMKSQILKETTNFNLYSILIMTLPSVVTSLFIGSWTDTYINAKKYLLMAGAIAGILEAVILIFNVGFFNTSHYVTLVALIPGVCTGGLLALFTAVWSYIASTTPPHMRAMRMTFAEITIGIANPLGTYFGGLVLNTNPIFSSGQLHNYTGVFAIYGLTYLLALLWTIYMVDEKKDIKEWIHKFNKVSDTEGNDCEIEVKNKLQSFEANKDIHPMKLLFNFNNVKDMIKTCCKPRDNHVRLQIWLLFLSMSCYLLAHIGPMIFMYQFSQKVYEWDSGTYSNATAIASIATALGTMTIAPILLKFFKLKDTTLSMVGLVSYFSLNLIRGLVLSSAGFYYALIPGCLGGIASIGIRSHFSKIIERHELGKVFSCLAAIEAVTPLMSASFFTTIFNATMDSMPGLSLILVALILIIPFGVVLWIHGCTQMPDIGDKPKNNHKNNINNNITDDKNTEMKEITLSDNEDLSDNKMFQSV